MTDDDILQSINSSFSRYSRCSVLSTAQYGRYIGVCLLPVKKEQTEGRKKEKERPSEWQRLHKAICDGDGGEATNVGYHDEDLSAHYTTTCARHSGADQRLQQQRRQWMSCSCRTIGCRSVLALALLVVHACKVGRNMSCLLESRLPWWTKTAAGKC